MEQRLTQEDKEFRRLVVELEGHQAAIASCLGLERSTISRKLNTKKHGAWWRAYKKHRARERKRASQERWRKNSELRRMQKLGIAE